MNLLKMSGSTLNSCDRAAEYVVIPPHIKTLKPGAFHGCTALRKVVFSYGIRDLPDGLFHNCIALREVVLPSGLQTIGKSCFRDCRQLRSVRIPSSCHNIGAFAFFGCERLESVTLPFESVAIEEAVFEGCSDLHTVVNLSHIVKIGKNAFYGCESLSNEFVVSSFLNEIGEKSFCRARVDHLRIPQNICVIPPRAFQRATGFSRLVIPQSVQTVGEEAFRSCYAHIGTEEENLARKEGLKVVILEEGVREIGKFAFADNPFLKEVLIPNSLKKISSDAFWTDTEGQQIVLYVDDQKLHKKMNRKFKSAIQKHKISIEYPDEAILSRLLRYKTAEETLDQASPAEPEKEDAVLLPEDLPASAESFPEIAETDATETAVSDTSDAYDPEMPPADDRAELISDSAEEASDVPIASDPEEVDTEGSDAENADEIQSGTESESPETEETIPSPVPESVSDDQTQELTTEPSETEIQNTESTESSSL